MTARRSILVYLTLTALTGACSGALNLINAYQAAWMAEATWLLLASVAPYVWFYLDSAERNFPRTYRWSAGIILFSIFAVPMYLIKSRSPGHRLKACGKALGALALSILLPLVASLTFVQALP